MPPLGLLEVALRTLERAACGCLGSPRGLLLGGTIVVALGRCAASLRSGGRRAELPEADMAQLADQATIADRRPGVRVDGGGVERLRDPLELRGRELVTLGAEQPAGLRR